MIDSLLRPLMVGALVLAIGACEEGAIASGSPSAAVEGSPGTSATSGASASDLASPTGTPTVAPTNAPTDTPTVQPSPTAPPPTATPTADPIVDAAVTYMRDNFGTGTYAVPWYSHIQGFEHEGATFRTLTDLSGRDENASGICSATSGFALGYRDQGVTGFEILGRDRQVLYSLGLPPGFGGCATS